MAKKITGRVEIVLNGNLLLNKEGAVARGIGINGEPAMEREPVLGDTGMHGAVEKPVPAECEVTISDREDQLLSDLAKVNGDGTVIFRAQGGGKAYTLNEAYCANNLELTAGQGETTVKFFGNAWTEGVQ